MGTIKARVDTGSYATMYGRVVEVNLQLQILLLVTYLALGQHSSYSLPVLAADGNNYGGFPPFIMLQMTNHWWWA